MPKVLIPLAQGCEELEAVTIIDILRRADIDVITVGLDHTPVTASRGVRLIPDTELNEILNKEFDMIVLPGGLPGADNLDNDPRIKNLVQTMSANNKYIAAICAAPKVLANAGILDGKSATAYPGTLENRGLNNTKIRNDMVVKDGNIITSRGPGTAMDFALVLVESLAGREKRDEVESKLTRPD